MMYKTTLSFLTLFSILAGLSGCSYIKSETPKTPPDELFFVYRETGDKVTKGYMDKTGKIVIGPWETFEYNGKKYDDKDAYYRPLPFFDGMAGICFVDKNTDPATKSSQEFADSCGFMDKTGKVVVEPKYKKISYFSEGLAAVSPDGENWGYVDKTGKMVVEAKFYEPHSFHDGLAVATLTKGEIGGSGRKWGFIDPTGKFVIEAKFDGAGSFGDGLAPVDTGRVWTLIDKTGKEITCDNKSYVPEMDDNLARITFGSYTYDQSTALTLFTNGVAPSGKGYVDKTCKQIVENKLPDNKLNDGKVSGLRPMSENIGLAKVFYSDISEIGRITGVDLATDGWFFIDKDFKALHKDSFSDARPFAEGLAAVKNRDSKDGEKAAWGFLKPDMTLAVPHCFDRVADFRAGVAKVSIPSSRPECSKYSSAGYSSDLYIDKTGNLVTPQWPK